MGYAKGHQVLTYLSWVLSALSALLALVPFWYIWRIIHDILGNFIFTDREALLHGYNFCNYRRNHGIPLFFW